jgi:hypothetical protein
VGAPGLRADERALAGAAPARGLGRYPLAALGVRGAPSPSRALLTYAPDRDDLRDADVGLAALVTLAESVAVVDSPSPDSIAAVLHRAGRRHRTEH